MTLVPVAAVLVASIQLHFLNVLLHLKHRGPNIIPCDVSFLKGEGMGWFQHGNRHRLRAPRLQAVRECKRRKRHPHWPTATAAAGATPLPMKPENATK